MASDSDLKLDLLDELCDELDESGIEGNIIERDSRGRLYVNIWYGDFKDHPQRLVGEMFTVVVTDYSLYFSPDGCYEIKPPNKYCDYFDSTFKACRSRTTGFYVMGSDQIIRVLKHLFNIEKLKENNMNNNAVIEARSQLCHIIACEVDKSPLRWTDGENIGGSIYIHNRDYDGNKVCRVSVGHASSSDAPVKAYYSVYFIGKYSSIASEVCKTSRITITSKTTNYYIFALPRNVIDFVKEVVSRSELEKENNMSEFTLATKLFGKLKNAGIRYKFSNGVYNPEEITIIHRPNNPNCGEYGLALVRSIPDSEDSELAYEVNWTNVPSYVLTYYKINRVQGYQWSDDLVNDILQVEKELKSYSYVPFTELPTIKAVDVIFNDPATIIIWADGSKTVVKAENEKFDPEKGLAMAISKKVLGNKHDYYEVFKRYVGRYEKKQGKKAKNNK